MELQLSVVSYQKVSLDADATRSFRMRGGTIGRARDNDWILPDGNRVMSSHHARILYERGCYLIEDTSSNGTLINHREQLARGQRCKLEHGDTLAMGDYEIHVRLLEQPSAAGSDDFIPKPFPHEAESIVDWNDRLFGGPPVHAPVASPPRDVAEWHPPGQVSALGANGAQSDHVPADLQHFVPPRPVEAIIPDGPLPPVSEVLPDDWWKEDDVASQASRPPAPSPSMASDGSPCSPSLQVTPSSTQAMIGTPLAGMDVAGRATPEDLVTAPGATAVPAGIDVVEPDPSIQSRPSGAGPDRSSVAPDLSEPDQDPLPSDLAAREDQQIARRQLQALLDGLGIPHSAIKQEPSDEWFKQIGALLRIVTGGTLGVMQARMALKSEFRLAQTIVRPACNNPLKFSVDVEQALRFLLIDRSPGFMDAESAFTEAFQDIQHHEIAVVAGMRAAFERLLREFAPTTIEDKLKSRGKRAAPLPFSNRNWFYYKEFYQDFVARAGDDFQGIFGEDFVRAYEEQIRSFRD